MMVDNLIWAPAGPPRHLSYLLVGPFTMHHPTQPWWSPHSFKKIMWRYCYWKMHPLTIIEYVYWVESWGSRNPPKICDYHSEQPIFTYQDFDILVWFPNACKCHDVLVVGSGGARRILHILLCPITLFLIVLLNFHTKNTSICLQEGVLES